MKIYTPEEFKAQTEFQWQPPEYKPKSIFVWGTKGLKLTMPIEAILPPARKEAEKLSEIYHCDII